MRKFSILTAAAVLALAVTAADARTVKWARGADALTLDPHGQNEGPTIAFNNQVYESLITRDNANKLIPALAVSWKLVDPTTWEFKLRPGVKFHGGEDFTRRRRGVLVSARARADLGLQGLSGQHQGDREGR